MANTRQSPFRRRLAKLLITIVPISFIAGLALKLSILVGLAVVLCGIVVIFGMHTFICSKCGKRLRVIGVEVNRCSGCGEPYFEEQSQHEAS